MAFGKLITFLTITTIASTQYSPDSYQPLPSKVLQVPEYISENSDKPQISLTLQIPKESAPVPFNTYAPSTDLKAPEAYETPSVSFYEVPVPSQDLELPNREKWNPNNDPTLYYELPVEITKETVPTNLHPKKYNKQVFEKVKPISTKPKELLVMVPVSGDELNSRRKQQEKVVLNFAKAENQKLIQQEKVKEEPVAEASNFESVGAHDSFADASGAGKRMQFEMHGHAGPKSYKWGYDTGAGKNRQFRYEERDKDGHIKGHYGYYDKHGKLQTVHYDAHPDNGFHAETS